MISRVKWVLSFLLGVVGNHCTIQASQPDSLPESSSKSIEPNNDLIDKKAQSQRFDPNGMANSHRLWIDGEMLCWKSNMGSLEYGIESESTTLIKDGHVKHPHFDWDWGLRLGIGYKLPYDQWDIFLNYTYLHGHAHGHAGGAHEVVFPTWASVFGMTGNIYANKAEAHWHMNLNLVDIELGRNCFAGQWLTIRPFLGIRGLLIDQDYTIKYKGGTLASQDVDKVSLNSDFWGVGLRLGFNSLWELGRGFAIYGNGSAALLSGNFDVHEKEKLEKADFIRLNITNDTDNVVATADLALGLQWDYMLSKDRLHFGVKLGWEFNIFFDQNQLFNFMNSSAAHFKSDDLSFHGLTLGFRVDF